MSDTPTNEETKEVKGKKPRSTAYPAHDLETAIGFTKAMRDNLGSGPYSRELAAKALGHANGVNGTSAAKIAACVHFGLLTRDGNTYSQSELSDMILTPRTENEAAEGIKLAALSPTLYSKLVNEYEGSALPGMLENILVRTHKLTEKVASEAAANFKKSVEYAGILVNGVINSTRETKVAPKSEQKTTDQEEEQAPDMPKIPTGYLTVIIPNTDVRILFPAEYAFDLSIGTFGAGIKALAENIKQVTASTPAPATTTAEESDEDVEPDSTTES